MHDRNQLILFTFAVVVMVTTIVPAARAESSAEALQNYLNHCQIQKPNGSAIQKLTWQLDRLSRSKPLLKLGAQWIILQKSHWRLSGLGADKIPFRLAANPYDPTQKHELYLGRKAIHWASRDPFGFFRILESQIFPGLLKISYKSFESGVYHYTLLTALEEPLRRQVYSSDLREYDRLVSEINQRLGIDQLMSDDPVGPSDWPELLSFFKTLKPCNSNCTERMSEKSFKVHY